MDLAFHALIAEGLLNIGDVAHCLKRTNKDAWNDCSVARTQNLLCCLQGVMLLARFTEKSPEDYDAQYAANQGPVRLAGEFVASLAELMPKVVSNQVSQLQAYLACNKAYSLRGALLQATGSILVQVRAESTWLFCLCSTATSSRLLACKAPLQQLCMQAMCLHVWSTFVMRVTTMTGVPH